MKIFDTTLKRIGDLNLVDYNPRKQDRSVIEKIKKSISEFGFVNPLVVNKNNNIIGGNQRYIALKELYGMDKEVPGILLDLDDAKEKALNIALNKISGDWEFSKLTELLGALNSLNMADLTGFDKSELNILDIGLSTPEIEIKPSDRIIRYPVTFYFENVEDKIAAESYFANSSNPKELIISKVKAKGQRHNKSLMGTFKKVNAYILIPVLKNGKNDSKKNKKNKNDR
jgi:hypothetical protein